MLLWAYSASLSRLLFFIILFCSIVSVKYLGILCETVWSFQLNCEKCGTSKCYSAFTRLY